MGHDAKRNEVIEVDAILTCAKGFAVPMPGEDNAEHLKRLIGAAAELPAHSDHNTDAELVVRLGLHFTIYKMLESYLSTMLVVTVPRG